MIEKFRGVSKNTHKSFIAHIGVNGKYLYLGSFKNFEEAKAARLSAEVLHFGSTLERQALKTQGNYAYLPLHGNRGRFYGWAKIDITDIPMVKDIQWTLDPRGYVVGRPSGQEKSITLHRWLMSGGIKNKFLVDHIDGDKTNNTRSNLRFCSPLENARNTKMPKNNSSGYKGVSITKHGRWRARITVNRKEILLGYFDNLETAAEAYDKAALKFHGEFASPNFKIKNRGQNV